MKDDLNQYHIINPDGRDGTSVEGQRPFSNDSSHFVQEDSLRDIDEIANIEESYAATTKTRGRGAVGTSAVSAETDIAPSKSSSGSNPSSVGILSLAGTVTMSVVAAVIVVAAFVSSLVIDLSLVMSDMYSLVVEVKMTGAQEEDFEDPLWAVLTGDNVYREQEVTADTLYLTFADLEPGKEYLITIKNSEKVFVEKSYFTASVPLERGEIFGSVQGRDVFISVCGVKLGKGEYFTVTAKNGQGRVLFARDDDREDAEYRFTLDEVQSVYLSLSVGGKVYAVAEVEIPSEPEPTPEPDPSPELQPQHQHEYGDLISSLPATCEEAGKASYYRCASCGAYFDEWKNEISEEDLILSPLGHAYGEPIFTWTPIQTLSDEPTDTSGASTEQSGLIVGYDVTACFVCQHDQTHLLNLTAVVTSADHPATCESDACVVYTATVSLSGDQYDDVRVDSDTGSALGHLFGGEPAFVWTPGGEEGYTAVAVFTCQRDPSHTLQVEASVSRDGIYYAEVQYEEEWYFSEYDPNVYLSFAEDDSRIYITPSGYARSASDSLPSESEMTPFVSSAEYYYHIEGALEDGANAINIYQTDETLEECDIYLLLDCGTLAASGLNDLVRIYAKNTVNLHLFFGSEMQVLICDDGAIFSSQGEYDPIVNVYLYRYSEQALDWSMGESGLLFRASSGEMHVYLLEYDYSQDQENWTELDPDSELWTSDPSPAE